MASRTSKSSGPTTTDPPGAENGPSTREPRPGKGAVSTQAGPSSHLEIETKLEIGADVVLPELTGRRSLRAAGLHDVAPAVVYELDAVYYDTDALDLLQSKLTLRRRTGGEDAGWHLKLPARTGARTEMGVPLDQSDADPLTADVPPSLRDLVQGASRGRQLHPIARICNRRTVRRLLDAAGSPMVEVADDHVTAARLVPSVRQPGSGPHYAESAASTWRELEVEVLGGYRDQLASVVSVLEAAGAKPASSVSKLARALGVVDEGTGRRAKGAGPTLVVALRKLRDTLIRHDCALREGSPTAVHDARAAGRRMRSVLAVYSPLFSSGATRKLRADLQNFGVVLGRARDLEVLKSRLAGQLIDEPPEYASVATNRINAEFAATLPPALADVAALIRSQRYFEMLQELDAFIAAPPFSRRATKPAESEFAVHLASAWRTLSLLVDQALADPVDHNPLFHDIRKAAKALRYAAEAAAATLGENIVVFAAAIEEIQEVLGEHQDALTAAAWLAHLALRPDTDGISGFVFGRLHAFEQAIAAGTIDDFSDAWDRVEDGDLLSAASRSR